MERLQAKARARYAFAEFLGGLGKRCTPERLQVLDIAMEQRKPFKAEELLTLCANAPNGLNICRATLFNTLPLLVQCGLLRRNVGEHTVTYETLRSRSHMRARCLLICTNCGSEHRMESPDLEKWVENQHFRNFTADAHTAVANIRGTCNRCKRLQNTKNQDRNSK